MEAINKQSINRIVATRWNISILWTYTRRKRCWIKLFGHLRMVFYLSILLISQSILFFPPLFFTSFNCRFLTARTIYSIVKIKGALALTFPPPLPAFCFYHNNALANLSPKRRLAATKGSCIWEEKVEFITFLENSKHSNTKLEMYVLPEIIQTNKETLKTWQ